ncbi:Uracil phosphoribosyltransferase [Schizosaccharomyces pombe]|uniref:Uracil phosphoribosyltransferase 2 n=1 Tax=Schizosaccharomyces pombe (strain 972 / ATCC 24843) TaxID=284812 RepID=UPP2_SCHPO|nr:putative uracil phosphoribosyltransferase [Schizosaccharomyces pombe]Q9HE15.1 RecName: Full=Uracil phosphoribosyltransferase 2; Short=UPRTase 2; AltName: Full=UMP pyrophosphorylase 2 [Schizosaccharomyces pombe 972h-]CAC19743.1 uracil phosphoribosyltransferase (predicted) [Schizosaccharomyces pombe]|eukprot:NP_593510.1 putative uracil phosphoribosyltransferase [Schizosaccharomyces pombe]
MSIPLEQPENVVVLRQTMYLLSLMTILRDQQTGHSEFVRTANLIINMLMQEALSALPYKKCLIKTSSGGTYTGVQPARDICGVSILRAGESMEYGLAAACNYSVPVGKLLVQRDETTFEAKLMFCKLPKDAQDRLVLLLDPLLATGNSVILAIQTLINKGIPEENIVFVNLIACNEGITNVFAKFPKLRMVTASIDPELNANKYVVPGCGDFGDRYFGTC